MSEDILEVMARAIEACTDEFTSPVRFYVQREALSRWERANPGKYEYDEPTVDWELESWKIIARAALAALEKEGWVVVPREPTEAMLGAADGYEVERACYDGDRNCTQRLRCNEARDIYIAMLDAAPKP